MPSFIGVVTGKFGFTSNPELGLFLLLKDADSMDTKPFGKKDKLPPV